MVTRHGAKKFVTAALPEIKERLESGYTLKEIHHALPGLANNISYSATLRNLQKMGLIQKNSYQGKKNQTGILKTENDSRSSKEKTNAERNREKLTRQTSSFSYDPHTKGKDLI